MKTLLGIVLGLGLMGCGAANMAGKDKGAKEEAPKEGGVQPGQPDLPYSLVATLADLPKCDDARKGQLVYLTDVKEFRTCETGGAWTAIDIKGAKGDQGGKGDKGDQGVAGVKGDQGERGEKGATGESGSSLKVVSAGFCSKQFNDHPNYYGVYVSVYFTRFSSGYTNWRIIVSINDSPLEFQGIEGTTWSLDTIFPSISALNDEYWYVKPSATGFTLSDLSDSYIRPASCTWKY